MQDQYGDHITEKDVLSAAMYPQVFKEWQDIRYHYGTKLTALPTRAFLAPLDEDDEISVELAPGSEARVSLALHVTSCMRACTRMLHSNYRSCSASMQTCVCAS